MAHPLQLNLEALKVYFNIWAIFYFDSVQYFLIINVLVAFNERD